jgi:hypothetical protein
MSGSEVETNGLLALTLLVTAFLTFVSMQLWFALDMAATSAGNFARFAWHARLIPFQNRASSRAAKVGMIPRSICHT